MHFDDETTGWKAFENGTRTDEHLFVIPDIHGHADLLEQMLVLIARIPGNGRPRTIAFLGDLIDRGPESFRAIQLALDAKNQCDKRIYLPGNHEGMLLDGLDLPLETTAFYHWFDCGGSSMVAELPGHMTASQEEIREQLREALPAGYLDFLRTAPGHYKSGDLLLLHGGLRPPVGPDPEGERERFLAQPLASAPRVHWARLRHEFLLWKGGWDKARREIVIHGHTVMCENGIESGVEAADLADHVSTHARISLDMGTGFLPQLLALEVAGGAYRFHYVRKEKYLP